MQGKGIAFTSRCVAKESVLPLQFRSEAERDF
jgi:hypothetical protein